jgi:hypothetical protein
MRQPTCWAGRGASQLEVQCACQREVAAVRHWCHYQTRLSSQIFVGILEARLDLQCVIWAVHGNMLVYLRRLCYKWMLSLLNDTLPI